MSETIATSRSASALIKVDFPTFGAPVMAKNKPSRSFSPRPASSRWARDFASDRAQGGEKLVLDLRRQVLVGKVDQRFLIGEDASQPVRPVLVQRAKLPFELSQGLPPLRFGFRRDQVVDGFGFDQIHPAVQESAPGELARFGGAQAGLRQRLGNAVDDRASAMQVQFGAVLAGVGVRAGEP